MLPGPQRFYYQFFTANAGLVTSFGDLVNKIDNGTATRNDYIDVIKDVAAVGASTAGLITLVTGTALPGGVLAIGLGLAALDYLDSKDYDLIAIKNDFLNKIEDIDTKKIEEEFGKKYSIPTELITGEITRESKFFEIKRNYFVGIIFLDLS